MAMLIALMLWHDSPERELGLTATVPLIEGATHVKPVSGLGLWFRATQQGATALGGGRGD
jgi:antibiotic biosynthesis monooxygenase (ABM) superfamily enzyme